MIFKSRWLDVLHRIRQGAAPAEVSTEGTSIPSSPTDKTPTRTFDSLDSESLRRKFEDAAEPYTLTEEDEVELEAYIKQAHPELHERAEELYKSINSNWIAFLFGRRDQRGSTLEDLKTTFQEWAEFQQKKITLSAENTFKRRTVEAAESSKKSVFSPKRLTVETVESQEKPTFLSKRLTAETAERTLDSLDSESQRGNSKGPIGDSRQWILSPDGPGKILWCSVSWDRAAVVLREDLVNLAAGRRPIRFFEWSELRPMPRAPPEKKSRRRPSREAKFKAPSLFEK